MIAPTSPRRYPPPSQPRGSRDNLGGDGRMVGRVLLVDHQVAARKAVEAALTREGLAVESTSDGKATLDCVLTGDYALAFVDLDTPGGGLEGCRRIRRDSDIPLMIASSRATEADRVLGLEAGGDDYVTKPLALAETVSRVRALLRRRWLDLGPDRTVRRAGDLEIDLVRNRVSLAGRPVRVTPTEFRLLALLARRPGRPCGAHELLRELWQTDSSATPARARPTSPTCAGSSRTIPRRRDGSSRYRERGTP